MNSSKLLISITVMLGLTSFSGMTIPENDKNDCANTADSCQQQPSQKLLDQLAQCTSEQRTQCQNALNIMTPSPQTGLGGGYGSSSHEPSSF